VDDYRNIFTCPLQKDDRRRPTKGLQGQHYRYGDIREVANGAHLEGLEEWNGFLS